MKKLRIISFIILCTLSFIFSGCSSSVNNTKKIPVKKTRTTNKTPVNNNPIIDEDDDELQHNSALIPLTLEAIDAGTILIKGKENRKLFIQKNKGFIEPAYDSISVEIGDKISFYGKDYEFINSYSNLTIECTADCYVYGNVMSLLEYTDFAGKTEITKNYAFCKLFYNNSHIKNHESLKLILPATTLAQYCYSCMFCGCTGLSSLPSNLFPATTLAQYCYNNMFSGCTGLSSLPSNLLPATSLAPHCYHLMFNGCTNLSSLPQNLLPATSLALACYLWMFKDCTRLSSLPQNLLPATNLSEACYYGMFEGCTGLISVPPSFLPASTLTKECYKSMFKNCSGLNYIKCLATNISATDCTKDWLAGVRSNGVFVKAPSKSWPSGSSGIPSGWKVHEMTE